MVVKTLEHGRYVFQRLARNPWIVLDTETEAKLPWGSGKKDGVTWGRAQVTIFAACYRGESYSFPTCHFSPEFPTPRQWFELLKPIILSRKTQPVFHNVNYDLMVLNTSIEEIEWGDVWDTMIAGWIANPALEKSLKARAIVYGRFLQETKTVDFSSLKQVGKYAEQDVIVADEMYQMQRFGKFVRLPYTLYVGPDGLLIRKKQRLPLGKHKIKNESLSSFDTAWLELLELPALKSTIRAEKTGYPMDQKYLRKIKARIDRDREGLLKSIYRHAGKKLNLNSPKELVWLFDKLRIHNPYKTPKGQMARGKNILPKLLGQHSIIQELINHKKIDTLTSFYFGALNKDGSQKEQGLAYFVNPTDGRIHAMLSTVGSITGRNTCAQPNLMQIPSRADMYGIKRAFVAPGRETR